MSNSQLEENIKCVHQIPEYGSIILLFVGEWNNRMH